MRETKKSTTKNSYKLKTNLIPTHCNHNKGQKEPQLLSNSPQKPTTSEIEIPITLNWVMPIKSISNTIKDQDTSQKRRSKKRVF